MVPDAWPGRRWHARLPAVLGLLAVASLVQAQGPVPVLRGQPDLLLLRDSEVTVVERLDDGGVLAAGDFAWVNGLRADRALVRLQADGSAHPNWQPVAIGSRAQRWANGVASEGCGAWIYVVGQLVDAGGTGTVGVLRLDRGTGARDADWAPAVTGHVSEVVCDGEGGLLLGGSSLQIDGVSRQGMARLQIASATLDTTWQAQASDWVREMLLAQDGSLYIAGNFSSVFNSTQNVARDRIARILPGGVIDEIWNPAADFFPASPTSLAALATDGEGWLYIGGQFVSNVPSRYALARVALTGTGAIDPGWGPLAGWLGSASAPGVLTLHREGQWLYVGGHFESAGGLPRLGLVRLPTTGTGMPDPHWQVALSGLADAEPTIVDLASATSGSLWVAGSLRSDDAAPSVGLARVSTADGARIGTQRVATSATVDHVVAHPAGGVVIAGGALRVEGDDRQGVLRIDAAGALDPLFDAGVRGEIKAVRVDGQGRVHLGGVLESDAWSGTRHLVRLLPGSGTPDPDWQPELDGAVGALAFDEGGRLYVGGAFTTIAGYPRSGLARFLADASLDVHWDPDAPAFATQSLAASTHWLYAGTPAGPFRYQIAAPGARDPTWSNGWIQPIGSTLLVRPNGQVVFAHTRQQFLLRMVGIIALSPESGPIAQIRWLRERNGLPSAVGGDPTSPLFGVLSKASLAAFELFRLDDAGTIDASWMPTLSRSVWTIVRTTDDSLWLGGEIGSVDGQTRFGLAAFDLRGDALFEHGFD